MQDTNSQLSVTLPAQHAASIARLLERCAAHEDERLRGRVTFPKVVMVELALEARHWARYLRSVSPVSDAP